MAEDYRQRGSIRTLLGALVILALIAAVVMLLSERNQRTWYLVPDEGRLVVMHGTKLPFGREAYTPVEPELQQAYAPVVPPPGATLPPEKSFDERALLDQALFTVVEGWARGDVDSGVKERLARGIEYLKRAERLPGLSAEQHQALLALRAESGFFEAQGLLERAAGDLRGATERLRAAAGSRSPHAADARLLLKELEPAVDSVLTAVRQGPRPVVPPGASPTSGAPAADGAVESPRPEAPATGGAPPAPAAKP
ncbi:MAG: hypothetical protein QM704_05745 [Anaeromyxobacteraceae bacterium]